MSPSSENADAKVHPASREILPDDPLEMHGFEIPGDPSLMLRLLVEEYARMGWGVDQIMQLAGDPNYQAFYGLYRHFGDEAIRKRVADVVSHCGVFRVSVKQVEPVTERLVQIDMPK